MTPRVVLAPIAWMALGVAMALQIAWVLQPLPWWARVLPIALTAVTLAQPASGLLASAAIVPLAGALGVLVGPLGARGTVLEQVALAFVIGVSLRYARRNDAARLNAAAMVFGALAAVSAAVALTALVPRALPDVSIAEHLSALASGVYFERAPTWTPLHAAMLLIEGVALAVAVERVVRARPSLAWSVLCLAVVGVAAVAALNLERIVTAAVQTGDFAGAFPSLLLNLRVSRFYDVNAAGSVFVLALFASLGLIPESGRRRAAVLLLFGVLLVGLWASGSRTALVIFALVAVGVIVRAGWTAQGRLRWLAGAALGLFLVAIAAIVASYPAARNFRASGALQTRIIMAETAANMWRASPVFGVGVGRFHAESSRYGGEALRTELQFRIVNENAHNYFLQVLAECGALGLVVLLWLIAPTLAAATRRGPWPVRGWLALGLATYLATWVAGHPQLVPDAALLFWLLLGLLAGLTDLPASRRGSAIAAALVLALVASAPFRIAEARRGADLEHVGIGLSVWHRDAGDVAYREAGREFSLYLPADGSVVRVPMRSAPGTAIARVRIEDRSGATLSEIEVRDDAWREVTVTLRPEGREFDLVRFVVTPSRAGGTGDGPLLHVGRAVPR